MSAMMITVTQQSLRHVALAVQQQFLRAPAEAQAQQALVPLLHRSVAAPLQLDGMVVVQVADCRPLRVAGGGQMSLLFSHSGLAEPPPEGRFHGEMG